MLREATAMTVRNNLGELLNEIKYRKDSVLITKAGRPVAALVDAERFKRIQMLDDEFKRITDKLADAFSDYSDS